MKHNVKTSFRDLTKKLTVVAVTCAVALTTFVSLPRQSEATSSLSTNIYDKNVPKVDINQLSQATRLPSAVQLSAFEQFKGAYGNKATVRWNKFSGSPDIITGFHTAPSSDTPENTARAFIAQNSALFGVEANSLVLTDQKEALGGYMVRFQQKAGDLNVLDGGLGFYMNSNKQIRMVMGSTFRDVNVDASTVLNAAAAATKAESEIAQYAKGVPGGLDHLLTPGLDAIAAELAPVLRAPRLNIFPTADSYKLAWNVITFSRNPFGLFVTQVDAQTGEILSRSDLVRYQQNPLPYTADIYPSIPGIANYDTGALKLVNGVPQGLQRVNLRNVNPATNATAVDGIISGKHALVRNVLATKQPFAQGALGTFHFRQNNAPIEAQPNETDDLAEPAEHFDTSNMYFFINYLLEYIDDIHKRDDAVHNRIGQGDFPDNYVNSDRPLVGLIHIPNISATSSTYNGTPTDQLPRLILGLDNAFSVPVSETVDTPAGPQKVVVNPTAYGHGFLLNDLAKDGPVAYHEGMHSISTPIAGLEGDPEGSGLNEAQADLWAYAVTGDDAIGVHSIKGSGYRQRFRNAGRDPESLAWIRSARSTLKYSQLGTYGNPPAFEEHKDGEIFAATMFELLELMKTSEPLMQFKRPAFGDGQPTRTITRGQESWERIFLGSLYLLGLTAPDTFVKARDSVIMADRILYPTDPSDLDAPGQHEALIWQVFAAREMGVNAASTQGGVVTISTAVPEIASQQNRTGAPQGVTLTPVSTNSVRVSWQPVSGAYAYQVFKRRTGRANQRQYKGIPGRPFFDGDQSTTGWSHVGYALGGNTNSFDDKGVIEEVFAPAGIKSFDVNGFNEMFGTEYAVRAISLNPNRQSGFSDLSGTATFSSSIQDISNAVTTAISNVSFANGVFQFDQTLKNNGIQAADTTAYGPISFKILSISDPTVTVANADNGGNGKDTPGIFQYNQTLAAGQTSAAKRLKFNDPNAKMFTFDALITARVRGASVPSTGSQPHDGNGSGQQQHTVTSKSETYTGTALVAGAGQTSLPGTKTSLQGLTYVDVPFTAQPGSFGVTGVLSTPAFCDLDFYLLDSNNNVLASSGNLDANEEVSGVIVPGATYKYRVINYASYPTQFTIVSTQFFSDSLTTPSSGGSSFGQATTGVTTTSLVRFTVNPLTGAVTGQVL
ncbi:MAG: M36 family metallopeptidase [Acidobacteriota bacterium]|nr:M36 family metallopeptidase [Acidobacteriota bacterium]